MYIFYKNYTRITYFNGKNVFILPEAKRSQVSQQSLKVNHFEIIVLIIFRDMLSEKITYLFFYQNSFAENKHRFIYKRFHQNILQNYTLGLYLSILIYYINFYHIYATYLQFICRLTRLFHYHYYAILLLRISVSFLIFKMLFLIMIL